jgi:hypothetical protein
MRVLVIGVLVVAMARCGGSESKPAAATNQPPTRSKAAEIVYLYRVQGDDPLPDSVSLRADGTADVRRGGGHGGFRTVAVALSQADAAQSMRLVAKAPWKALDGHTVTPGGFGGWDNDMRYMLRRGKRSITVTDAHMPRSIRPLIRNLNAIIEGGTGRQLSSKLHSAVSATMDP